MVTAIVMPTAPPMKKREARELLLQIRQSMRETRLLLLDLFEREGWRALGYSSWRECVSVEFAESERHLYRLLAAAQLERELTHGTDQARGRPIPERQLRELARLDTAEERRAVWEEATADGDATAAEIAELVSIRQGNLGAEESRPIPPDAAGPLSTYAQPGPRQGRRSVRYWTVTDAGELVPVRTGRKIPGDVIPVRIGDVLELVEES